jgi:hypothetical protein
MAIKISFDAQQLQKFCEEQNFRQAAISMCWLSLKRGKPRVFSGGLRCLKDFPKSLADAALILLH